MTLDEIHAVVEAYVVGVAEQDRARLTAIFAETATVAGLDEGNWITVPRDRWIDFVCAPERRGAGKRDFSIETMTMVGTIASVVVADAFGRFQYRDVLVLADRPGGVQIVGKTFHQEDLVSANPASP